MPTSIYEKFLNTINGNFAQLAAQECESITLDMMEKFSEWLNKNRWYTFSDGKWDYTFEHGTSISKQEREKDYRKTTQELIRLFINKK
jgi:hypothetical protein